MQVNTADQVAIVTGAGRGIGLEICKQLARQGVSVLLNDLDVDLAREMADEINSQKGKCLGLGGDASDLQFIRHMVEIAVKQFGKLTMAVANTGVTLYGEFLSYTPEDLNRLLQVNLSGSFFLAQAAARQMKAQGSGGSILLMSSVTGHQAHRNLSAYAMTKAALEMLAKNLVIELSPYQITINAIAPGATLTERTSQDSTFKDTWSAITPMGRLAYPEDIAHAATFLLSDKARHITGQTLIVDGGWSSVSPSPYDIG
jgi:glucose 1-dehydrogenase